jgi:hypothetical protein
MKLVELAVVVGHSLERVAVAAALAVVRDPWQVPVNSYENP